MRVPDSAFWRGRRVFVTGATGLLGSHLAGALHEMGAEVIVLVRDNVPHSLLSTSGVLDKLTIVRGSVTDFALLRRTLVEYEVQTTFHLAAQTIVSYAYANPLETFDVNIMGTCRLLEACRVGGKCGDVVVASSDKAYGPQEVLPYTESSPMQGSAPYDVSKSCADLIVRGYARTYGMPVAVTRLANLFGPGDLNFNRLIPGTIKSALLGQPIEIRSDGTMQREYLYVENGVQAYLILAEDLNRKGLGGEAFNFGQGYPLTVLEVVEAIKQVGGFGELEIRILNEAKAEIQAQYLDCTKSREKLNWDPKYTFEEGLAKTIDWYRDRVAPGD